ncbi:FecR family protein [Leptolyngbya sp. FACHB-17]|uniref:FecR family protein n=1 Tax=unclassified Leptolyngbya TaxID=2650499 RepID=UPI001680CF2D|nr:FecR family protein [Leptolyngbya sp. FACHB-17]MBD2081603.1 FecR domain-containing protein [Leptolyngbya sp. FACHB-17]
MRASILSCVFLACCIPTFALAQTRDLRVRADRWLLVQRMVGSVNYDRPSGSRPARVGDRLQAIGEGITTGVNSRADLLLDTGVGVINVLESTRLRVRRLEVAGNNGRITHLNVTRGQVRLKLRRFTNRGSQLEIQTPAGLSGVRGTDFGVAVQPDGKTGIATLTGAVVTAAQGGRVWVPRGFQNLTIPGERPSPAVPLRNDTTLRAQLVRRIDRGVRKVQIVGRVDPVNIVRINEVPQILDRNGAFRSSGFLAVSFLRVKVEVITPLGKSQTYELALE